MFYTYMHTRNDTNEVFYVGKGKRRRPHDKFNRNRWWWHVVNKVGYTVHVLGIWETDDEALEHEIFLIRTFKEMGYKLVNAVEGGKGCLGMKHTEEARKKMSESRKGKQYALGHKHTPEARANMAAGQRGRKHAPETLEKMRKVQAGEKNAMFGVRNHPSVAKAVICTTTGEEFASLTDAANAKNVSSAKITLVCQGKRKSTGGLHFKYKE